MSSFLAPATVTAALTTLLQRALDRDLPGAVPGATVTTLPPNSDKIGADQPVVNIYLFRVTPDPSLRHRPAGPPDADRAQPSRVSLNLRYLVTFYGDDAQLEPQRLMGMCVRVLSENAQLSRNLVEDTIDSPRYTYLASSKLGDTTAVVNVTMASRSLEELSQIWSIFSPAEYRLSLVYEATVVVSDDSS